MKTTKAEAISIIDRVQKVIKSCETMEQMPAARAYLSLVRKRYPFIGAATDTMCKMQEWKICVAEEKG